MYPAVLTGSLTPAKATSEPFAFNTKSILFLIAVATPAADVPAALEPAGAATSCALTAGYT